MPDPALAQRYDPAFPIDQLVEHPDNPRRGDEAAIDESMAAHGFYGAVIVQQSTKRILAGNHRTRVAARRGDLTVPVLWLDVDDDRARRILLVDNRTNDFAGYDEKELARLLEELSASSDMALVGTGYDAADLARLLDRWNTDVDPDAIPETPEVPRTVLGDLWLLGRHRLLCGDSTDADCVSRLLDGITPMAMVTDPPYLVDYTGANHPQSTVNRAAVKDKSWDTYHDPDSASAFFELFIAKALEHLAPAAPVYQWHASRRSSMVEAAWTANGLFWHQTLVWVKARAVLTRSDFMWKSEPCGYGWRDGQRPPKARRPPPNATNVWELPNAAVNAEHPTIKPVRLYTDPYTWHLRADEWAYEPFSGSGTAIAAAEVTGRRCAAMELEPAYVDVACRRWQDISGQSPVLERTGEAVDFAAVVA